MLRDENGKKDGRSKFCFIPKYPSDSLLGSLPNSSGVERQRSCAVAIPRASVDVFKWAFELKLGEERPC